MLTDYRLAPLNGGAPKQVVIFLHGLGDRGDGGLLSIGQIWQRHLPECEFLCPDAPFAFDMAPPEFGGRQWFSLQNHAPESLAAGVEAAAPILNAYIDDVLKARNLAADRLALVGFSQGTMMALHVALRRSQQIACVIGYSGLLTSPETLAADKKSAPPVLLLHGTADDVVPFARLAEAEKALRDVGISVSTVTCPGIGHTIDDLGLGKGGEFLRKHFGVG